MLETIILNAQFNESIETVCDVTNYFCEQLLTDTELDPFNFERGGWYDRSITEANIMYADVFISVKFLWKSDQQTWIAWVGDSQKYLGYIEISKTRHTHETPVNIRIVDGGWPPLGMFWRQLADNIWQTLNPNGAGKQLTQIIESVLGLASEYDVRKRAERTRTFFDVTYCQGATGSLSRWMQEKGAVTICRFETTLLGPVWRVFDKTGEANQDQFVYLVDLIKSGIKNGRKRQSTTPGEATTSTKREKRGSYDGTDEKTKEFHRLMKLGEMSQRKIEKIVKQNANTYREHCLRVTGEEPIYPKVR